MAKWPHTPREEKEKRRGAKEGYTCRPMSKVMAVELLIKLVNHLNNVRMTNHS